MIPNGKIKTVATLTCPKCHAVQTANPGDWVIHCHIPEHMEAGMMSEFKVI